MKDITPSAPLGEMIVNLLSRPHAPVSRQFIDRQLNKQREPRMQQVINDTLIWLHLMGRIQKQFREPRNHDELEEATVFFWIADVDYDGYVNDVPNLNKYTIATIIGSKSQPPQTQSESAPDSQDEPEEEPEPEPEPEDAGENEETQQSELDSEPEPVESKEDLEKQIMDLQLSEPVAPKDSADKRILDWARMQLDPWTRDRCVAEVEGTRAIISMRLGMLVSYGRLKENSQGLMIIPEFAKADFFAITPKPRTKTTRKPRVANVSAPMPPVALAQQEVAAELFEPQPLAKSETLPQTQLASFQHFVIDAPDPKFSIASDGALRLEIPNFTLELSPSTMKVLAAYARRFNLMHAYED